MSRFASYDGVQIAYYEWGTPNGSRPVVLHHGFSADSQSNWVMPGVVDALREAGRLVVAIDARGHGGSDKPHDPAAMGENIMSRDLSVLLDVLEYTEVDLIGYSMGAVVSAITATRDARVRRLVLSGVGCALAELGGVDGRVFPANAVLEVLTTDDPEVIANSPARPFRAVADSVGADRDALIAQLKASHRTPIPLRAITATTLVLVGTEDVLSSRPEVLAAAIPGARCQTVPGDHLQAVRAPEFASNLVEFLARTETPA